METLAICLTAVKKQVNKQTEIIVVDDCSTQTGIKEIAGKFTDNYFRLKENVGAGRVRNFGAMKAKGEWLIFIDSDVIVSDIFFNEVIKKLKHLQNDACLQGVYGWETPIKNIYSQYKNLYYFYNYFNRIKKENYSYLSSHCFILKKKIFKEIGGFNRKIKTVIEDADFGFQLIQKGYELILDNNLMVTHLKKFSLISLLKNDAKLSFAKAKHVLRNIHKKNNEKLIVVSGGRISEMYPVILSVLLSPIVLFVLLMLIIFQNIVSLYLMVLLLFALLLLNYNFMKFVGDKKGFNFLLKVIPVFYLDMLFSFFGTMLGILDYSLFSQKY